jgi:carboxypeptidase C (cathepsin A)
MRSQNMWFWFFEARNNASTAPLAVWLTGGPGCSSMVGLFQENGPCTFNNVSGSIPELNPYSWNTYANVLYVDQPVGTGFSYGNENKTNTTPEAAPVLWAFMQTFYAHFSNYQNRDFALFTESYGGHYGPNFATYLWVWLFCCILQFTERCSSESQNAGIDRGTVSGTKIPMIALGINNGWVRRCH